VRTQQFVRGFKWDGRKLDPPRSRWTSTREKLAAQHHIELRPPGHEGRIPGRAPRHSARLARLAALAPPQRGGLGVGPGTRGPGPRRAGVGPRATRRAIQPPPVKGRLRPAVTGTYTLHSSAGPRGPGGRHPPLDGPPDGGSRIHHRLRSAAELRRHAAGRDAWGFSCPLAYRVSTRGAARWASASPEPPARACGWSRSPSIPRHDTTAG